MNSHVVTVFTALFAIFTVGACDQIGLPQKLGEELQHKDWPAPETYTLLKSQPRDVLRKWIDDSSLSMSIRIHALAELTWSSEHEQGKEFVRELESTLGIPLPYHFRRHTLNVVGDWKWLDESGKRHGHHAVVDVSNFTVLMRRVTEHTAEIVACGDGGREILIPIKVTDIFDTDVAALAENDRLFVAAYNTGTTPFEIACIDSKTSQTCWKTRCRGADDVAFPGRSSQVVEMRISGDELRVFGVGCTAIFIESFDLKSGKVNWRFCSRGISPR